MTRGEGVIYHQNKKDKSFFYLELEPLFATGKIELLDHPEQTHELRMLERRPRATGRTLIDHPTNQHDDHANELAIAAAFAKKAAVFQGLPIGIGRGLGAEIQKAGLSWRDSPNPFTNDGRLSRGIPVRKGIRR